MKMTEEGAEQSEQSELHCGNEQLPKFQGKNNTDLFLMVVYLTAESLPDRIFL